MNSKKRIRKAVSTCLAVATIAASSMITLANSEKITGELLISGKNISGETQFVKINGENAQNGRSVFSSSLIVTPKNVGAVINLGKVGKIELAPDTNLVLSFSEKGIDGNLLAGQVNVLDASDNVSIRLLDGTTANLAAGESATVNTGAQDDDAVSDGGSAWIIWAAVLGAAGAGIIIAATSDNNRVALGSSSSVVSPTR